VPLFLRKKKKLRLHDYAHPHAPHHTRAKHVSVHAIVISPVLDFGEVVVVPVVRDPGKVARAKARVVLEKVVVVKGSRAFDGATPGIPRGFPLKNVSPITSHLPLVLPPGPAQPQPPCPVYQPVPLSLSLCPTLPPATEPDPSQPLHLRVRERVREWELLDADPALLQVIRAGVTLPLQRRPTAPRRPQLTLTAEQAILKEMKDLVRSGAARPLSAAESARTESWTPCFQVPKRTGGTRLIMDLRLLNKNLTVPKFRADTWKTVESVLSNESLRWAVVIDFTGWFHHLSLAETAGRWVRVSAAGSSFQVVGLPFGLSASPFWAQRLARPVIAHLRAQGWPIVWYVDDLLITATSPEELSARVVYALNLFLRLGLSVNFKKSVLIPSQVVTYLGMQLDLLQRRVYPAPNRRAQALAVLRTLRGRTVWSPSLLQAAGILNWMQKGIPAVIGWPRTLMKFGAQLRRRHGNRVQAPPPLRHAIHELTEAAKSEITTPLPRSSPPWRVETDASTEGWGGILLNPQGSEVWSVQGKFSPLEILEHITCLETRAAAWTLEGALQILPDDSQILLISDCVTTKAVFQRGSTHSHLNHLLHPILERCAARGMTLRAEWRAGVLNDRADMLSRQWLDCSDFRLSPHLLFPVLRRWRLRIGVDCFSNRHNCQASVWWSATWSPGTSGTNALAQPWGPNRPNLGTLWMNPPWALLPQVALKLQAERASNVVMVVPVWRQAVWYQSLIRLCRRSFLLPQEPLYIDHKGTLLPPPRWRSQILAF
jgi:hypothetical protein